MYCKIEMKVLAILTTLICLVFSSLGFAQEGEFTAKVYPIDGEPMLIDSFTMNDKTKLYAEWRGSYITLLFQEIRTIQYLAPGSHTYSVEINFNSGRKDEFVLMPGVFHGRSVFGEWSMHPEKAVTIEFNPSSLTVVNAEAEYRNFDQVIFKNGDTVSGQVLTKAFKMRTSYATLSFETPQIGYIDFDGKGPNRDIMGLRIGDTLSGILEAESIKLLMRSGAELNLHKDKIRKINFILVKK